MVHKQDLKVRSIGITYKMKHDPASIAYLMLTSVHLV